MPPRKNTVRPNFDFATMQRRRKLKSEKSRDKEADRILRLVLKRTGGIRIDGENRTFSLKFSGLQLESLPIEIFEDEFLYEKCERFLVGLDLSANNLKFLDKELGDFGQLKTLDCSKNR